MTDIHADEVIDKSQVLTQLLVSTNKAAVIN